MLKDRRKFDLTSWLNAQEKRGRDVRAELLAKDNELRKRLKQGKHHV